MPNPHRRGAAAMVCVFALMLAWNVLIQSHPAPGLTPRFERMILAERAMNALRQGSPPETYGGARPGGMPYVAYNDAMHKLRQLGDDAVPLLIAGLDDEPICDACLQILGDLRTKQAMPKLLSLLSPDDTARDGFVLQSLGTMTDHNAGSFYRFYFDERTQQKAYQTYLALYEEYRAESGPVSALSALAGLDSEPDATPLPAGTTEEQELARLMHGKTDPFANAIRAYMKSRGPTAAIPFLIASIEPQRGCGHDLTKIQSLLVETGAPAVPALIAFAQRQDDALVVEVANTLLQFDTAAVMPILIAALQNNRTFHRERIVRIVTKLESRAASAVPVLRWILAVDESASLDLQWAAAGALCDIGPDAAEAGPEIVQFLRDQEAPNEGLPRRRQTPPPGRGSLNRMDFGFIPISFGLIEELGKLGPDAEGIVDFLIEKLDSPRSLSPFTSLTRLGPAAAKARPALRSALTNVPPTAQLHVWTTLRAVGDPLGEDFTLPLEDLRSSEPDRRSSAVFILAEIAPQTPDETRAMLRSAIQAALHDEDPSVQSVAQAALDRLDSPERDEEEYSP